MGWSKISTIVQVATVVGVVGAIVASVFSFQQSERSYEQSAEAARQSLGRQANITAMQMIESHYRFAAEKGVGLSGAASEESPEQEATERLVAQHGLLTANLVFDLTEETLEHNEAKGVAELLLERYEEELEQADFPCRALDDEFVQDFARKEVGIDPCRRSTSGD